MLTNEHIVRFPGKLTVVMDDGELRSATLVSHDAPFTDLALLRIPSGGLKALAFGDSDNLVPGETVLAIGSPDVDYQNSVTVGVASGLHRRKRLGDIWLEDLIQTDAAINVGSSGGPLLNLAGEVVGMITFRDIGTSDPLFGISFALSSNSIQPIVRSIIEDGGFPRPYFGIEHRDIDEELLASSDLAVDQGALIERVYDGSPAQTAGFRPGDVIPPSRSHGNHRNNTFLNALAGVGPNDRVTVAAWRDGVRVRRDPGAETTMSERGPFEPFDGGQRDRNARYILIGMGIIGIVLIVLVLPPISLLSGGSDDTAPGGGTSSVVNGPSTRLPGGLEALSQVFNLQKPNDTSGPYAITLNLSQPVSDGRTSACTRT